MKSVMITHRLLVPVRPGAEKPAYWNRLSEPWITLTVMHGAIRAETKRRVMTPFPIEVLHHTINGLVLSSSMNYWMVWGGSYALRLWVNGAVAREIRDRLGA